MQLNITGHHVELTEALQDYVGSKLDKLERHYDHMTNVQVTLTVDKQRHIAEATLNVTGGEIHGSAEDDSMYAAIDLLVDKLDRQLIKHKEKMQARQQGN